MAKNYSFLSWRLAPSVVAYMNRTPEKKAADAAAFKKFQEDADAAIDKLWKSSMCYKEPYVMVPGSMCPFN
jgi:hypothetical protein